MKIIFLLAFLFSSLHVLSQKEIINSDANWPVGIAEKDDILYIAEGDIAEITTINLNDPNLTKETYLDFFSRPIFLDIIGDYLYYSGFGFIDISRVNLTQTNPTPEVLVTDINTSSDFIVDGTILYYTKPAGIYKIDLAAVDPIPEVVIEGQNSPKRIIKHGDYLYYSELWEDRISRINLLDMDPTPEIILSELAEPSGLAIHDNELFFIQYGNLEISKFDLTSTTQVITTIDTGIYGGDLLFIGNDLYATSIEDGLVVKYNDLITVSSVEVSKQVFKTYPNPTFDYIYFKQDQNYTIKNISISTISGGLVNSHKYSIENERLDLSNLSPGVYFIKFIGDKWIETKKIIRL